MPVQPRGAGEWVVSSAPAVSLQATATKAAGAAGVKHVARALSFGLSASTAVAATIVVVNLRDGATGAGGILQSWQFALGANVITPMLIHLGGLDIRGTPAVAMTLEFSALLLNLLQFVNLVGYDE